MKWFIKLIFKAYKNTNKTKKDSEKEHVKHIKTFWRRKKWKKVRERCQNFTEEKNEKNHQYYCESNDNICVDPKKASRL